MDKRKLVNIIIKDLEELKILSEEVADSQDDSSLVIDLALNKARLLCQEIELLRELPINSTLLDKDIEDEGIIEVDEDVSDISFTDPELEILNFEEDEFQETGELSEEEDIEVDEDEENDGNDEEDLTEENMEEDLTEESEEEDLIEVEEETLEEDEDLENYNKDTVIEEEFEEPLQKTNIQITELKNGPQPGTREIHVDDPDDDNDNDHIHFSNLQGPSARPTMREIPKPDNAVIGETFQKERSLNDSIGENKSLESNLSNSPITSLRAAIGLNDRFIFIREIFNNNTDKYNTIIDKLDKMERIQEAVEYLKANLSMQKNEASLKFVDLLKRRFTK
jgi:hypothetical protein